MVEKLVNSGLIAKQVSENVVAESNAQGSVPATSVVSQGTVSDSLTISQCPRNNELEVNTSTEQSTNDFGSFNLISNTCPLGYYVTDKVRGQIWADQYVELSTLLPKSNEVQPVHIISQDNSGVKITTESKAKGVNNIHQWNNAFDIFMSLYILKHSDITTIQSLLKYANTVRNMATDFGFPTAKLYDEEFRKLRSCSPVLLPYSKLHDELWQRSISKGTSATSTQQGKTNRKPFQGPQRKGQFPRGFCWKYLSNGECTNEKCTLKHFCPDCGEKHAADACRKSKRNSGQDNKSSKGR